MSIEQTVDAAPVAPIATRDDCLQLRPANAARVPGHDLTRTGILPQLCIGPAQVWNMTAQAAYYLAIRRGFAPGHELEDWLAAEKEVLSNLM